MAHNPREIQVDCMETNITIGQYKLKGSGLSTLWQQALAMILLGGTTLAFSVFRFNKRLE